MVEQALFALVAIFSAVGLLVTSHFLSLEGFRCCKDKCDSLSKRFKQLYITEWVFLIIFISSTATSISYVNKTEFDAVLIEKNGTAVNNENGISVSKWKVISDSVK